MGKNYKFNQNYFDVIDTEDKAYWIGFIWCDGYLGHRKRKLIKKDGEGIRDEYNLKISLHKDDYGHLEKFNKCIDGNYPINFYKTTGFDMISYESRIFITNKYMGELLENKYGIVPRRHDCSKLISHIPDNLFRHFIRGVLDADGSIAVYMAKDRGYISKKYTVSFGTTPSIINYIEKFLIKHNIIDDFERKKSKRHQEEHRDINYRVLNICGQRQVEKTLDYIYKDATIYLDRKYEKYINEFKK